MKGLVTYIASSLVDEPSAVRVREVPGARETRIEVRVAEKDVGKIIGRQGRTARAVRTLLLAAGRKNRRHFTLEIVE
jgi:predicted RNA-binding protein YlqC (UPF0109 family)